MSRGATSEVQRRALRFALARGHLTLPELWLTYFSLGGLTGEVEVDAYLHGAMDLPAGQRDMLAHALNERLGEELTSLRVPYDLDIATPPPAVSTATVTGRVVEAVRQAPPARLVTAVTTAGASWGATVVLHLVDDAQELLVPVRPDPSSPDGVVAGIPLPVGSGAAGEAYRRVRVTVADDEAGPRWWVPVHDDVERLGVLEVVPEGSAGTVPPDWEALAALVGRLVTEVGGRGDALDRFRRDRVPGPATELVRDLLPPLTTGTERCTVAGVVAHGAVGGGAAFDHALSATTADLAVVCATGRDPGAGLLVAAAVAAARSVRRGGGLLSEQVDAVAAVTGGRPGSRDRTVSGVWAELDLAGGRLRCVVVGRSAPLLLRGGVATPLTGGHRAPFGVDATGAEVLDVVLQPGDRLLLPTDRVIGARDVTGAPFGVQRLADALQRHATPDHEASESVRLLAREVGGHQHGALPEDVALLLTRWHPPRPDPRP